jgi:hypothetical protein
MSVVLGVLSRRTNRARVRKTGDTHGVRIVDVEQGNSWVDAQRWRILQRVRGSLLAAKIERERG